VAVAKVHETDLDGLWLVDVDVHDDPDRAGCSFREGFRRTWLEEAGAPAVEPVQFNVAESTAGTLRGLHAEPWEKFIHVAHGEVFACIADVRPGSPTVGRAWTGVLGRDVALLVTRGLANGYQALSPHAVYTYLVNDYWVPGTKYPAVAWDDPDLAVAWPIRDDRLQLSAKDRANPSLREVLAGSA
jgi:dTDP-4-dehydrorhamnose 3,5-epimerase